MSELNFDKKFESEKLDEGNTKKELQQSITTVEVIIHELKQRVVQKKGCLYWK